MVRPFKRKFVNYMPNITYFKPQGVPLSNLEEVELTLEELEALRLLNLENLSQTDAAKKMQIHQSTIQRTLARAKTKITDALVNGKAIKINGGNYKIYHLEDIKNNNDDNNYNSNIKHRRGFQHHKNLIDYCICSKCGYSVKHELGTPCNKTICPKCKTMMMRK